MYVTNWFANVVCNVVQFCSPWIKFVWGFTWWPFIFIRPDHNHVAARNHEWEHWKQWLYCGVVFFPLIYLVILPFTGYRDHPFEKWAREAE